MRREAQLWLKSAEEDYFDAEAFYKSKRYFRTAFFAQQAVEKALKAMFIVIAREDPPKIHTVTELYRILTERSNFRLSEEIEEQLFFLNKFYSVTRYPDAANGLPSESVDRLEAERALRIAKEVIEHARKCAGES
ncbi:MAG: hypothetical protein PWQ22_1018 [Archaeoglobaceae archaeon]|nr:hypothetical protein [Archaeoglobaceae archaeon]MDK2876608.1 hypothetical protein [Archaeoglobaceae archaeon]